MAEKLTYHEVYKKYKNLVLKVAYNYSGDYGIAEDIMQNTFLKLYAYFGKMHQENLKAWLYTTAKHAALNYRKKVEREILCEESEEDAEIATRSFAYSAEEEIFIKMKKANLSQLHEKIMIKILEKNPRWYEAIVMVYFMEIPQAKVAEEMGISINVLHSMLHRAKEWIRKEYGVKVI